MQDSLPRLWTWLANSFRIGPSLEVCVVRDGYEEDMVCLVTNHLLHFLRSRDPIPYTRPLG